MDRDEDPGSAEPTVRVAMYRPARGKHPVAFSGKSRKAHWSETSNGDLLRKVVALGGRSGSAQLRDWATRELWGYGPNDDLPPYRRIGAPLQMDAGTMRGFIRGQHLSPW